MSKKPRTLPDDLCYVYGRYLDDYLADELIYPADVALLEGIHVFYDPAVRDLLDFKIFIQVDPDICLLRRVQRDIVERARHVDSVARQYLETVKPMFERYIRNYVEYAGWSWKKGRHRPERGGWLCAYCAPRFPA